MHTMRTAAALVASAALVVAAPAELAGRTTFHVEQVSKGSKVLKSGPLQMMKTYSKYAKVGAVTPSDVQVAAAAVQSGSVSANPEAYDQEYLCPVNVGGTTMMLDFDTGSADLWVFSNQLPANEQTGHALYKETGTKKSGYTWSISYGDGSGASGNVYGDKVVVGAVTATSQAVEAATSISSQFVSDTDNDGLLGLAFSSINTVQPVQQTTFFDTVKSTLSKALFTVTLKKGAPGTYTFGYIDSSKYSGSITYVPVNTANGFWQFTATGVSGNSIADTGTSLLYLPDSNVSAYYSKVSGAKYSSTYGGYVFPCSTSLPSYSVVIGGTTFTVPGSYINYAPANSAGTTCFGGIQSSAGIGFNIFGDVFLKAVMVVFDVSTGSPRLGFAKQA